MKNKVMYIVRHGNTFDAHQTPLRVGCNTDLPLSSSGIRQLEHLAKNIHINNQKIDHLYASKLLRAKQSAEIILQHLANPDIIYTIDEFLNEVDYGVDDGQTEEHVVKRIGKEAIIAWEENNTIPSGWNIQPQLIIDNWQIFINKFLHDPKQHNILLVTSNGLAKFLPAALKLPTKLAKLATGSISKICFTDKQANIEYWNQRP